MLDDWDGFCFGIEIWRVDVKVKELGSNFYPKKKKFSFIDFFPIFAPNFFKMFFVDFARTAGGAECGKLERRVKKKGLKKKGFLLENKKGKKMEEHPVGQ